MFGSAGKDVLRVFNTSERQVSLYCAQFHKWQITFSLSRTGVYFPLTRIPFFSFCLSHFFDTFIAKDENEFRSENKNEWWKRSQGEFSKRLFVAGQRKGRVLSKQRANRERHVLNKNNELECNVHWGKTDASILMCQRQHNDERNWFKTGHNFRCLMYEDRDALAGVLYLRKCHRWFQKQSKTLQ